jgi:hypothetical protein
MTSSIWAPRTNPVPLAVRLALPGGADLVGMTPYLDITGPTVQDAIEQLRTFGSLSIDSSKVNFLQAGAGAYSITLEQLLLQEVHLIQFMSPAQRTALAAGTEPDVTVALQAAIDSTAAGIRIVLPRGICTISGTIYLRRNKVRIRGQGAGVSMLKFSNAAGGIMFTGDTAKTASLFTYSSCALEEFEILSSGVPGNDPIIAVDLTSFSYGDFHIQIQTRRANAVLYYGQGNAGTSPYFNRISSNGLFGHTDYTQTAFQFRGGAFAGGSNGPNSNFIGPITRAASLKCIADIRVGLQNEFCQIGGESIGDTYFLLGGSAAVVTGTSTGANGQISLKDTTKAWTVNAYINGAVQITAGMGVNQIRTIKTNSATQLTLNEPWAIVPDVTSVYSIFEGKVSGNKFVNIRGEGAASLDPDFIYAHPGVDLTEFLNVDVSSLGAGLYLRDYSGSARNSFYGNSKVVETHTFVTPGPSANVNGFPRTGVYGGRKPAGNYVIEWMKVSPQNFANLDFMLVTLDVGGAAVGAGSQVMQVNVPSGNDVGMALPRFDQKLLRDGTNEPLFLNITTGAAFSAAYSVSVSICYTLK